ncbi:MAG: thioesterase [Bacteroidales bacterium]|nr:thioesterase [Bacteroidales bacterium]
MFQLDKENKLTVEELIPCYATDFHKYLRPTAFMDYAQELAYQSATALGFGYNVLIKEQRAWVLSRFHIKFLKPIRWGDTVKIQSWHKGPNGLFFLRDFKLMDQAGDPAVLATSSWIILDLVNRSFVRSNALAQLMPVETECHENAIETPAPKLLPVREGNVEKVGEHIVNYADIDCLGHTNNVRYVVWSMDAAGADITFKKPCRELFINFIKETHVGETVELFRHVDTAEDGTITATIEGRVEGANSFICKLVF